MGNFSIFDKNDKMARRFILCIALFFSCLPCAWSQNSLHQAAKALRPDQPFENILVRRIYGDDQATGFVIWIKQQVPLHKHANHSESVVILAGRAKMQLGDQQMQVRKGDIIFIPQGTPHAVTVSKGVLKVLSIQAPAFDGTDRILLN
jgi:mannose-6-phosphate isomerase-like protein (cupin superfamily)